MPYDAVKNFAKVTLLQGVNSSATSITLVNGDGVKLPDPSTDGQYNMVLWNATDYSDPADDPYREIIRVTAKSGDVLTVLRGQEDTTPQDHNIPQKVYKAILPLTKKGVDDLKSIEVYRDGSFVSQRYAINFKFPFSVQDDVTNKRVDILFPFFGGDGSDGELTINSGTTTIDLGGKALVVKNFSSISITGTAKLEFTNPHNKFGSIIILRSKGDVTITSSAVPAINVSGLGGRGGLKHTSSSFGTTVISEPGYGYCGSGGERIVRITSGSHGGYGGGGGNLNPGDGGRIADWYDASRYSFVPIKGGAGNALPPLNQFSIPLPGGGGGGSVHCDLSPSASDGGHGGGALYIECGGSLNFTGIIWAKGNDSAPATYRGGGGAGGSVLIVYNNLIANTGTIDVSGGSAGTGWNGSVGQYLIEKKI